MKQVSCGSPIEFDLIRELYTKDPDYHTNGIVVPWSGGCGQYFSNNNYPGTMQNIFVVISSMYSNNFTGELKVEMLNKGEDDWILMTTGRKEWST